MLVVVVRVEESNKILADTVCSENPRAQSNKTKTRVFLLHYLLFFAAALASQRPLWNHWKDSLIKIKMIKEQEGLKY